MIRGMPHPAVHLPDWSAIDTVLLDMDGTLLDLKFDNRFWQEAVPARFAAVRGLPLERAKAQLAPMFAARKGTLDWYCLDYWSRALALDIAGIKREARAGVCWIPGAEAFIERVRGAGKRIALVTNAHPDTLAVKDLQLDLTRRFDAVYSSHPFGAPKEAQAFWPRLAEVEKFDRRRTLLADDSLPVLGAAQAYGIGWVYAIKHPDSTRAPSQIEGFSAVQAVHELMPG
jgi:putative hydrolase of the HAD superfamily